MAKAKRPAGLAEKRPAGVADLQKRAQFLGKVELIRKLQDAGEDHRARLMHRNLTADADRLEGELYRLSLPGHHGGITAWQRQAHRRRIAALRQQAAALLVRTR